MVDQVKSEYAFNLVEMLPPALAAITELNSEDVFPIIWDSGTSVCITFDKDGFTDFSNKCELTTLKGFSQGEGQGVKGAGTISWYFEDDYGYSRQIQVRAYYVPTSRILILSLTTLLQQYKGESVTM